MVLPIPFPANHCLDRGGTEDLVRHHHSWWGFDCRKCCTSNLSYCSFMCNYALMSEMTLFYHRYTCSLTLAFFPFSSLMIPKLWGLMENVIQMSHGDLSILCNMTWLDVTLYWPPSIVKRSFTDEDWYMQ